MAQKTGNVGCVAIVLVILLILTIPLSLLFYNVGRVIFDKPLVKKVVTREVTESDLLAVTLEWFALRRAQERVVTGQAQTAIREPDVLKAIQFLERKDWKNIRDEALPAQIVGGYVSTTLDGVYDWLDSNNPLPIITLELKSLKDWNRPPRAFKYADLVYSKLPPCKQDDIDDFVKRLAAAPPGTEVLYNLFTPCAFPLPWTPDQTQDYRDGMNEVIDNMPDRFNLTLELSRVEKQSGVGAAAIKNQIRFLRAAAGLSPLVPILFLVLLIAYGSKSRFNFARWVGLPLLVGGLVGLLPSLTYASAISAALTSGAMSEVPKAVQAEFTRAFGVLFAEIFNPMGIEAAIISAIGLGVIIFGVIQKRKMKESAVTP
ncbi:MAG: hypothetical protein HY257_02380 [Chloroflexi bacterium]|nr:hypothetical protein [Chloroflexota bacterium]